MGTTTTRSVCLHPVVCCKFVDTVRFDSIGTKTQLLDFNEVFKMGLKRRLSSLIQREEGACCRTHLGITAIFRQSSPFKELHKLFFFNSWMKILFGLKRLERLGFLKLKSCSAGLKSDSANLKSVSILFTSC